MNLKMFIGASALAFAIFTSAVDADPFDSNTERNWTIQNGVSTKSHQTGTTEHHHQTFATGLSVLPGIGGSVLYAEDGHVGCRMASKAEAIKLQRQNLSLPLHYLTTRIPSSDSNDGQYHEEALAQEPQNGLKILMRATEQLENYPEAKQAFIKAARIWESLINSPITVVIDIDFGPERFGEPYDSPNVLGSTYSQGIYRTDVYQSVRDALIQRADTEDEASLYGQLPNDEVLTDLGPTAAMYVPSAVFRALGLIAAHADPEKEPESLGPPPNIGFNSSYDWDFNPDDGIEPGKEDFVGVALHEIGHALGFISTVGWFEMAPEYPPMLSVWDLFRLIPGAGADFTNAPRVLSSGGDQVFYAGNGNRELPLSTGRPDGSGGDNRQSSHWRDDDLSGEYIGVMDPTAGNRIDITANDLLALDLMGYQISSDEVQPEEPTEPLALLAPLGTVHDTRPNFRWNPAPLAQSYLIIVLNEQGEVAVNGTITSEDAACTTSETRCSARPRNPLIAGQSYRWWLSAVDVAGNFVGISEVATFKIE